MELLNLCEIAKSLQVDLGSTEDLLASFVRGGGKGIKVLARLMSNYELYNGVCK